MESVPIDSPVLDVEAWVISELGDVTNKVEVSLASPPLLRNELSYPTLVITKKSTPDISIVIFKAIIP